MTLGLTGEPIFVRGTTEPFNVTTRMSLSVTTAALDSPLGLSWTVTNAGTASAEYGIVVEGSTDAQTVAAGATGTSTFPGPVVTQVGERTVVGVVTEGGAPVARLVATAVSVLPLGIEGRHVLTEDGTEVLRLHVRNVSAEDITLTGVTWDVAGVTGGGAAGRRRPGRWRTHP